MSNGTGYSMSLEEQQRIMTLKAKLDRLTALAIQKAFVALRDKDGSAFEDRVMYPIKQAAHLISEYTGWVGMDKGFACPIGTTWDDKSQSCV